MICSLTSRWFGHHRGSLKKEGKKERRKKKKRKKGQILVSKDEQTLPGGLTNDLLTNIKVVWSP